jgi:hypothetical protein
MAATMARQGGRVKLEQSDMYLVLNMAKLAKEGFLHAAIKEMKYLVTKPPAEVREEKKRCVEFPRRTMVKTAIPRHPAMLHQNQTSGCLYCQHPKQRIRRHAGAPEEQVHLLLPDAECGLQGQLHLPPACHPHQPVTLPDLNRLKSSLCPPDIRLRLQLFLGRNFSKMMRILSTIPILIQIC